MTIATSETICTTANHPWLTADRGWLVAGALRVGEPVRLLDGGTATVVALHALPGVGPMWDLSLDATHTFAVGDGRYVVHNDNCDLLPKLSNEQIQKGLAEAEAFRGNKAAGAVVKFAGDDNVIARATNGIGKGGNPASSHQVSRLSHSRKLARAIALSSIVPSIWVCSQGSHLICLCRITTIMVRARRVLALCRGGQTRTKHRFAHSGILATVAGNFMCGTRWIDSHKA